MLEMVTDIRNEFSRILDEVSEELESVHVLRPQSALSHRVMEIRT